MTKYAPLVLMALQLIIQQSDAFAVRPCASPLRFLAASTSSTSLQAEKQTRSSLLKPPERKESAVPEPVEEQQEVFGAKFFGGNAIKVDLLDETIEEQADKLANLYPKQSSSSVTTESATVSDDSSTSYSRFLDKDAFDDTSRSFAQRLQTAMNQALYITDDGDTNVVSKPYDQSANAIYASNLQWKTPLSRDKSSKSPLDELTHSLNFYKRVDVAIVSAKSTTTSATSSVQSIQVKWEISLVWPNFFESRVLLTGSSTLTVDASTQTILSQTDQLDNGGKDGQDIISAISPQLQPRFWDLYHIGMTPSAELMPRAKPQSVNGGGGPGPFSKYQLSEIPPRLVFQPFIHDTGGRSARLAQALPNHAFSTLIKTTGPKSQRYVPTSPIEVTIRRTEGGDKSKVTWNVALPPEFVSYYDELPLGDSSEEDNDESESVDGVGCTYAYQPKRLVATIPYAGNAQDVQVSDLRKTLYEQIVKDGLKPKLDEGNRPQFFFLNNDAKACFTADGGLGMAVYEWRPEFADANEVGIELEG